MQELEIMLARLNPHAPLVERHLALIHLLRWIRGSEPNRQDTPQTDVPAARSRLKALITLLNQSPSLSEKHRTWWATISQSIDITTLLADFGFAPRTSFMGELGRRVRAKLLPSSPETRDAAELFELALDYDADIVWLTALDEPILFALSQRLSSPSTIEGVSLWQHELLEAIIYCASQIRSTGFAAEVRLRMSQEAIRLAFTLPKEGAAHSESSDHKSRVVFKVITINVPPPPAKEEAEKLAKKLGGELQTDQLIAFVDGLKSKFGVTLNEPLLKRFSGAGAPQ